MSDRSKDQFRDGKPIGGSSVPRWTGQWYVIVRGHLTEAKIIGTWWDEDKATEWADKFAARYPQLTAMPIEAEFKDWYIRPDRSAPHKTVEDVISDL